MWTATLRFLRGDDRISYGARKGSQMSEPPRPTRNRGLWCLLAHRSSHFAYAGSSPVPGHEKFPDEVHCARCERKAPR
jgi:hypothetical protein